MTYTLTVANGLHGHTADNVVLTPEASIRLKVRERIVTVLKAITTGTDYWKAPYEVTKRFVGWMEAKGFPTYMVFVGTGGNTDLAGAPDEYEEEFNVTIKGVVQDNEDPTAAIEHCIQDIRKAINVDSKSGIAGSLGVLADQTIQVDGIETDNGYLSGEGFGFFDFPFRVKIHGDYGVL
ncbi:MAG: hypothetical protein WC347_01055 [Smithellaceae bacterium]|jgi:hypothetical protein